MSKINKIKQDALVPTGLLGVLFQKCSYFSACGAVLTYKSKKINQSVNFKRKIIPDIDSNLHVIKLVLTIKINW